MNLRGGLALLLGAGRRFPAVCDDQSGLPAEFDSGYQDGPSVARPTDGRSCFQQGVASMLSIKCDSPR